MTPPEYRVYVTPEQTEAFEASVVDIGVEIRAKRPSPRDLPPITREDLRPDDLAVDLRSILEKLPKKTLIMALTYWDESSKFKQESGIQSIPLWEEFMVRLTPAESRLISRSLNTARRIKANWGETTIEDVKDVDWSIEEVRGLGKKTRAFLTKVFPRQTQVIHL